MCQQYSMCNTLQFLQCNDLAADLAAFICRLKYLKSVSFCCRVYRNKVVMSAITFTVNVPEKGPKMQELKDKTLRVPRDIPWWKDARNVQAAQYYARLKGLMLRSDSTEGNVAMNYPLTLQPHNFPQELYEEVWALQPAVNSLLDAVSRNLEFLEEALARYGSGGTKRDEPKHLSSP